MREDFLWVQKYRPKTVSETILPKKLKQIFSKFVETGEIPNLLLSGASGVGKTTVAKAMLDEIGSDYIVINASMNGNIDTLRVEIQRFASTVSFSGGRKYVILDEADHLTNQTQAALRNFMEEYSKNCGFILTCNFQNKILDALRSRCSVVEFLIPKDEKLDLGRQFFARAKDILTKEGVDFDPKALAEAIMLYYPDWRRALNELQHYAGSGKIDVGILANSSTENIDELFQILKNKKFGDLRKWVVDNSDIESAALYKKIYDELPNRIKSTSSIAECIVTLAQYQYQEAFVANSEINRMAALTSLMAEGDWK